MALTKAEIDAARTAAYRGTDTDLVAADRRTRAGVVSGAVVARGAVLTVGERTPVTVLGPGRGRDYFLATWKDPLFGVMCIGSFRAREIKP